MDAIHMMYICIHTYNHVPRVEWRGLKGNFNTPNRCFLYLQISVDLNGNLWQESEFQNNEWESLAIIRVSEYIKERKRTLCCA